MSFYTQMGSLPVVPVAELTNLISKANKPAGDTRMGQNALGKKHNKKIIVDAGDGTYHYAFSRGTKSSDLWQIPDGSAQHIPVNILNPGGQTSWTITQTTSVDDGTYVAGLLTVTTAKAALASQGVTLKAGNYRIVGTINRHDALKAVRLKATAATDGVVANQLFSTSTVDATDATKDTFTLDFTLTTASQVVTFSQTIETISNTTIATGTAFVSYSLEAGVNA